MDEQSVLKQIEGLIASASAPWCVSCREKMYRSKGGFYCYNCGDCRGESEHPVCISCRRSMIAHGYDSRAVPRWRCKPCDITVCQFTTRGSYNSAAIRMPDKFMAAREWFRAGHSCRTVARKVGIAKHTAEKYRKFILVAEEIRCPCGQLSTHRGFCWWRYQNSPKRQEFMKRWHSHEIR
jgi:transposase-like protein